MAVAGSLTYKTDLDKNGFEKGINSIKASTVAAGNIMADAIKDVIGKVVELGKSAVNSYADLEQNVGGVETLFKKSSDKVIKNAEKAYKTAGISANNYMSTVTSFSASLLQSLSGDTEKAADVADMALIDMADNANKFGTSMESIQNAYQGFAKQNYTMLDNLKLGYGGTKEEMERLLEDAQKITGIEYDITNLNDIFQAIHVIQQELDITGTTAKEAEETISGSVSSMKAAWDNFLNGSGTFDQFVDSAKIAFENIAKAVAELLPRIAGEIANALPEEFVAAVKIITPILITLGTALGVIWGYLKAVSVINSVRTAFVKLNAVMAANPVLFVVAAIAGLIAGFICLWNKCEWFRNFWIGLWDGIKEICSAAIEGIKGFFSDIGKWFSNKFNEAKESIIKAFNDIGNFFKTIHNSITETFSNIATWFSNKFNEIKNAVVKVFSTVAQWINKNVIQPIKKFFSPLVNWYKKLFESIFNCLASIVEVIIVLIQGCIQTIQIIWGMITEWFKTNVIQPVQQFFIDLWNMISSAAQTAWNFIVSVWTIVANWFNTNIIQPIAQFFNNLWNGIKEAASSAWNGIVDIWNAVAQWFEDTIITPVSDFFDTMWNKLTDGASSAWQGIKNVFSNITNWFRDKFSEAWNAVKNVFSTGGKIFTGITEGITATFKTVVRAIIDGINKVIKKPFDAINGVLNNIRTFKLPGGAQPFSGLPRIDTPQIPLPQLARGIGLAKKGHQYLLEGQGNEAVVPLDQNKYWTKAVATEMIKAINEQKSVSNSNAILKSSAESRTILIDNHIDGTVELEGEKAGRLLARPIMKVIKVGG